MKRLPLVLVVACLSIFGQPAPEIKKPAVIEGRVVNAKTGAPLRRVNLTLRLFEPVTMPAGTTAPTYTATTDAGGKFRIEKIEPGRYLMDAERQGFVRRAYGVLRPGMQAGNITLAAGQELRDIEFKLTPLATISGRVVDEEGEPLVRVPVQAMRRTFYQWQPRLMPSEGGQTDDRGVYRIPELAPGKYWVSASCHTRMMMFGDAARNTSGKPEEEYVTTYYPGAVDEAGARPVELQAGQEMSGIDIRMQKSRVYRIRGKVAGEQPPQGMRLMLMPRQRAMIPVDATVRPDGTFEIGSVAPGSYFLNAVTMQGSQGVAGKVAVDVVREDVENVTLVLRGGGSLKGSIRIDGDIARLEKTVGKKLTLGGVRVQLMAMEGLPFGPAAATATEDGQFVLENVGADKFRVMVMNPPQGTWVKSVRAGEQEVLDTGLDLTGGATGSIQITLGTEVGQISGTVQDAKQQAAAGSTVMLVPEPPKPARNDLYRMAATGPNGQFTMQGIPPGEYKLFAWETLEPGVYANFEFLTPHESKAQKISVKPDGTHQVTLRQIPAGEMAAP